MSKKKIMDMYLMEIFKEYIALKDDDLKRSQEVFKYVFDQVKLTMKEQCNYFSRYSSQVMYAGSVYDGIKVSKLDEFDMDIVIRLPVNYDDIIIENDAPGFVKLKIPLFDHLDKQPDWEKCHKVTREWRDSDKFFLQNKFRQWLHSIVQKALNEMKGRVTVNGITYNLKYKESGPAYTLHIRNVEGGEEFTLDVDLVPVIKFMHPRWPTGYKELQPEGAVRDWLVVPKPNKAIKDGSLKNRCWRLSFQDFERDMMKGCQQLKNTIRLVKKLRDRLEMKEIASYYIKTLFLWEIDANDKNHWNCRTSVIFRTMVEKLHNAVDKGNIEYFWHSKNNLIQNVRPHLLKEYAKKLKDVLDSIDNNDVEKVAASLLNDKELSEFKKSDFYKLNPPPALMKQESVVSEKSLSQSIKSSKDEIEGARGSVSNDKLRELESKYRDLESRVSNIEDRLMALEMNNKKNNSKLIGGGAHSVTLETETKNNLINF